MDLGIEKKGDRWATNTETEAGILFSSGCVTDRGTPTPAEDLFRKRCGVDLRDAGLQKESIKKSSSPMPRDCEINWGEDRPSIKGRNVFGMTLESSSKHHTANMRLLLIALVRI